MANPEQEVVETLFPIAAEIAGEWLEHQLERPEEFEGAWRALLGK